MLLKGATERVSSAAWAGPARAAARTAAAMRRNGFMAILLSRWGVESYYE
jgi:hypothetical protein